jgi:hypothetical protein
MHGLCNFDLCLHPVLMVLQHFECRLVAICEDIYAARAEGELELEEGLFWTIVKIYRAPYMLMEYTKVE